MDRFTKLREATAAAVAALERGEKPRLQGTLANLYFGFNPGPHAHELRSQLIHAIGPDLTLSAERGFLALLLHQPPPLLAELARSNAVNEYQPHWYAILAGMDLYWRQHHSTAALPPQTIEAVFALSLLLRTWDEEGRLSPATRRPWSQHILAHYPTTAAHAYETLLAALTREDKDTGDLIQRFTEATAAPQSPSPGPD
jgi:hypothetical protein